MRYTPRNQHPTRPDHDAAETAHGGSAPLPLQALTVDAFTAAYAVSRAKLYELWAADEGPDCYLVGKRRFIAVAAAQRWQQGLEQAFAG